MFVKNNRKCLLEITLLKKVMILLLLLTSSDDELLMDVTSVIVKVNNDSAESKACKAKLKKRVKAEASIPIKCNMK